MKKFIAIAVASLATLLMLAPTTFAAEFISPDKDSGNITLSKGEKHHNTYVAGGTVFINTDITGDLVSAGGTIDLEGNVEQDVIVAGGTLTLNGTVGGDVRIAGGTITINGPITGDLLVAGGTVRITEKATIGGDLAVGSGDVTIDGSVKGNAKIASGTVLLNSKIDGSVDVTSDQSFVVGPKAEVAQGISYTGVKAATVSDGAKVSVINFTEMKQPRGGNAGKAFAAIFTIAFVVKALGLLLLGILVMKLFPRTSKQAVTKIADKPWTNLGIGALFLIVSPILGIILLITFFGIYIAMVAFMVYGLVLLMSVLAGSAYVGSWIIQKLTKKTEMVLDWQALLIGIIVVGIVTIIPVIGFLLLSVLIMVSFGALLRMLSNSVKSQQA